MADSDFKGLGVIPDFFADIIAYIIPGLMLMILVGFDYYLIDDDLLFVLSSHVVLSSLIATIISYVIGRFLDILGKTTIHGNTSLFVPKSWNSPKWKLIFDDEETYTKSFRENLKSKIAKHLEKQDGANLMELCKRNKKDDYFNLLQFYMRERFPDVALYEKKQNATIVLMRSLSVIFILNPLLYHLLLFTLIDFKSIAFSIPILLVSLGSLIVSFLFFRRFRLDQKYHAMYIFETFISHKKLLKKGSEN